MLASGAHWARVGSAEAAPLWNPVEPEREASDDGKKVHTMGKRSKHVDS